jgi:tripartite-type tricarboxylate transporter receptor subunit TctC
MTAAHGHRFSLTGKCSSIWQVTLFLAIAVLASVPSATARADDFYAGKTLTIIAGLPPGGGVDGEMRVLARYFAKYIPGNPTIVARNMPGAAGIILANYLYNSAPADGLTLGMPGRSGFLLSNIVPQKGVGYDITRFSYIGSAGGATNALWVARRTGIASLSELKSARKEIVIGALNPRSENAIAPKVLAQYEGWPLKVVTGYGGFNEVVIAIERGEVDGLFSHEGSIANSRPDLIASGAIRSIVQSSNGIAGVPLLSDVVSNPDARALLGLVTAPSEIGLPLLGPPSVPADRLEILRASYQRLMADEDYRAEADRRGLPVGRSIAGADLQKLIVQTLASAPATVVKDYLALAGIRPQE